MKFGVDEITIKKIMEVFEKNNQIEEVLIYGSRAKGSTKYTNKIELALKAGSLKLNDLLRYEVEINSLKLDYQTTLCILNLVENIELKNHIESFGKSFTYEE